MQLKTKILFILLSLFVAFGALQFGVQKFIVYPSFIDLEQEQAKTNIDRVNEAIKVRADNLDILNSDWANWDDTAEFIEDHNQQYINSNLVDETLYNSDLNFMTFYDLDHNLVWGKVLDLDTETELIKTPFIEIVTDRLLPNIPTYREQDKGDKAPLLGLMMIEGVPVIISARSALSSDNEGPTRGFVVFGRFLTESILQEIREQTRIDFSITPALLRFVE
ncbi:CHASE4 domain-containing protein [Kiloniella sp.]|uniref:CHASE4 domain-containing protein n=1 Tax=Kiloniella sp. TaxID=1938587 RepID=UPI003B01CB07